MTTNFIKNVNPILKSLILLIISFSCTSNSDPVTQLCKDYNNKTPSNIDDSTTLISVTCTDTIFSFNYELDYPEFNNGQRFKFESMLKENIIKSVNEIKELIILKERNFKLGYIYYNKNKKPEIAIMFFVNEIGDFQYDEMLSQKLLSKLLETHTPQSKQ